MSELHLNADKIFSELNFHPLSIPFRKDFIKSFGRKRQLSNKWAMRSKEFCTLPILAYSSNPQRIMLETTNILLRLPKQSLTNWAALDARNPFKKGMSIILGQIPFLIPFLLLWNSLQSHVRISRIFSRRILVRLFYKSTRSKC